MKKILFPIGEREFFATGERLANLVLRITDASYRVDIVTYKDYLADKLKQKFEGNRLVTVSLLSPEFRFWTMAQRDNFAKDFIKLNYDIITPGTDMKFWKQVAFDDFLWHVSASVFPAITEHYDLVLFPIPSLEEYNGPGDIFSTNILFYAKDNNVPVTAIQVFPIYDIPPIFPRLMDYFIVKEEYEKEYLKGAGVKEERIFVLTDIKDSYCISTVEDPYKNMIFEEQVYPDKDTMSIVVVNHSRNRLQICQILEAIGELNIKKLVFFCFLNFAVKELHEKDVFKDMIEPCLKKNIKHYATVEAGGLIKALMISDMIVATSYIVPLTFAQRYNKTGVVYNPLKKEFPYIKNVSFTATKDALKDYILKQYSKKQSLLTITDIIRSILHGSK